MGSQESDAVQNSAHFRPSLRERRLLGNREPGDPVKMRKIKALPGRAQETELAPDDLQVFDAHQGDSAGTVTLVGRSLKVDGDKWGAKVSFPDR
jgi:hypothetical protein